MPRIAPLFMGLPGLTITATHPLGIQALADRGREDIRLALADLRAPEVPAVTPWARLSPTLSTPGTAFRGARRPIPSFICLQISPPEAGPSRLARSARGEMTALREAPGSSAAQTRKTPQDRAPPLPLRGEGRGVGGQRRNS